MPITDSTSAAFFRWRPACWLRVAGADAASFLQGQFTNDLRPLGPHSSTYGLWLTVKGKVLADGFVRRGAGADEFWIGSYFSPADTIRARLESYVIADDVTLDDQTAAWAAISVLGERAVSFAAQAEADGAITFRGRRDRGEVVECVYRVAHGDLPTLADFITQTRELSPDEVERRRIAAGIPAVPIDVGPNDLPNEAGLEGDAISYTKGCYLGQEVMARLKAMGQVRRRLRRVRSAGSVVPATPAPLFASGRQVGELRSAIGDGDGWIGLAMISLLTLGQATAVALGATAEPNVEVLD